MGLSRVCVSEGFPGSSQGTLNHPFVQPSTAGRKSLGTFLTWWDSIYQTPINWSIPHLPFFKIPPSSSPTLSQFEGRIHIFIQHVHLTNPSHLFVFKLFIPQSIHCPPSSQVLNALVLFIHQMSPQSSSVLFPPFPFPLRSHFLNQFHQHPLIFLQRGQRKHQMRAVLRLILQKFRVWAAEFLAEQIKTNLKSSQQLQGERGWKCIIQASWKGWDPISGHWDRKISLKLKIFFKKKTATRIDPNVSVII